MSCIYKYKGKKTTLIGQDEFYSLVRTTMVQQRTVQKYRKSVVSFRRYYSKVEGHTTLEKNLKSRKKIELNNLKLKFKI